MFFRQILHEDLSCASYLVGDTDAGVAAGPATWAATGASMKRVAVAAAIKMAADREEISQRMMCVFVPVVRSCYCPVLSSTDCR